MTERLLDSPLPLVAAPMAGRITTVELSKAVATAGAFPFLAGGHKSPEALAAEIEHLRLSVGSFGVNLFVPSGDEVDIASFAAYATELAPEASDYGLALDASPITDDDWWEEKMALLITRPVPVVSLTFGLPDRADIAALKGVGTRVLATVTSPDEARQAHATGVDGVVVQGSNAGGHSATFDPTQDPDPIDTADLVQAVRRAVDLPLIAAGGVDGPRSVGRLLDAGAEAVAMGTLLVRTDEAGSSATYKNALCNPELDETVITRAFTGRPARALRNAFIDRHQKTAPTAYPAVHHLTLPLRLAANKAGDTDRMHLWAGAGYRHAPTGPAAGVIGWLAEQMT